MLPHQRPTVRTAILSGFAVVLIVVAAAFALLWHEHRNLVEVDETLRTEAYPVVITLRDALANFEAVANVSIAVGLFALQVRDDRAAPADLASARDALDSAVRRLTSSRARLVAVRDDDGPMADPAYRRALDHSIEDILGEAMTFDATSDTMAPEAIYDWVEDAREDLGEFALMVQVGIEVEEQELVIAQEDVSDSIETVLAVIAVGGGLAAAASVAAAFVLARRVANPIAALRDAAVRIGAGEMDVAIDTGGEREVGELGAALALMARDLEVSRDRLARQERLAALGQVAGTVAHELRNPLGAIRVSASTVMEMAAGHEPALMQGLQRIDRSIDRCTRIIDDLLDFARAPKVARSDTDLDAWIAEVLDDIAVDPAVTVERRLRAGVRVSIDRERMRRAVANLVTNAAQAMTDPRWNAPPGRGRTIVVESAATETEATIAVADTGPGIPAELAGRALEPLFTTKTFGVGLGLPIVQQVAAQHGGTLAIEKNGPEGCRFAIVLPRAAL